MLTEVRMWKPVKTALSDPVSCNSDLHHLAFACCLHPALAVRSVIAFANTKYRCHGVTFVNLSCLQSTLAPCACTWFCSMDSRVKSRHSSSFSLCRLQPHKADFMVTLPHVQMSCGRCSHLGDWTQPEDATRLSRRTRHRTGFCPQVAAKCTNIL